MLPLSQDTAGFPIMTASTAVLLLNVITPAARILHDANEGTQFKFVLRGIAARKGFQHSSLSNDARRKQVSSVYLEQFTTSNLIFSESSLNCRCQTGMRSAEGFFVFPCSPCQCRPLVIEQSYPSKITLLAPLAAASLIAVPPLLTALSATIFLSAAWLHDHRSAGTSISPP